MADNADWQAAAHTAATAWAEDLLTRLGIPLARVTYTFETPAQVLAIVDGVQFRLVRSPFNQRTGLFGDYAQLVRPCRVCGQDRLLSGPLHGQADLGLALATFHPVHDPCPDSTSKETP